jgi:5-methyltetrahydropteroyltriglutamate--homocysteine methyltransferase
MIARGDLAKAIGTSATTPIHVQPLDHLTMPDSVGESVEQAINRALGGIEGTTALHTCFGYAHIVHNRPNGYPFLERLAETAAQQISLESAQQNVDLSVLRALDDKTLIVGVIDLSDESPVEDVETVAARIRNALKFVDPDRLILAPDCGMKYLPRDKAFAKLQALTRAADRVRAELLAAPVQH